MERKHFQMKQDVSQLLIFILLNFISHITHAGQFLHRLNTYGYNICLNTSVIIELFYTNQYKHSVCCTPYI